MSAARRALDGFEDVLDLTVFYDSSLCVSELVTNAVLHADVGPEDELELEVEISDDVLRVSVTDSGRGFEPGNPIPRDDSGFGLFIVDRLSDRWGVERRNHTRVWFEMVLHPATREAAPPETDEKRRREREPDRRAVEAEDGFASALVGDRSVQLRPGG